MVQQRQQTAAQSPAQSRNLMPIGAAIAMCIVVVLVATSYARNAVYHSSVTLWKSAVKCSPNKRRTHENYGQALSSAGFYLAALEEFKTVLVLKDDGSVPFRDLYREIGVVYAKLGQPEQALFFWEEGLKYASGDPTLLNNISIVLLQQGRSEDAERAAQQALVSNPFMPQALEVMGQVAMNKKEYDKAAYYLVRTIEREPSDPSNYWNAIIALKEAKKYDLAYAYAVRYLSMDIDPATRQIVQQYAKLLQIKLAQ